MIPTSEQLGGLSIDKAECFGKPHWMAEYDSANPTKASISNYRMQDGAFCMICGRAATNVHHVPARRHGLFTLDTPKGSHVLRPALIALCGSGTTGCHGKVHSGEYGIEWSWDLEGFRNGWWDGSILECIDPHDLDLYEIGYWRVIKRAQGVIREARL